MNIAGITQVVKLLCKCTLLVEKNHKHIHACILKNLLASLFIYLFIYIKHQS